MTNAHCYGKNALTAGVILTQMPFIHILIIRRWAISFQLRMRRGASFYRFLPKRNFFFDQKMNHSRVLGNSNHFLFYNLSKDSGKHGLSRDSWRYPDVTIRLHCIQSQLFYTFCLNKFVLNNYCSIFHFRKSLFNGKKEGERRKG